MNEEIRVRRVGSVTCGISLIIFGVLFLIHLFYNSLSYVVILKFWPLVLIGLGIELLASYVKPKQVIYDKGAVALMILMSFFAACMAGVDIFINNLPNGIVM